MRAPVLAVGDCALGFWSALRYVSPKTRHERDWARKSANVLDSLPKSVHRRAKGAIKEITRAENKIEASIAIEAFASEFGAKWPKAVSKITSEKETLLAFYDYPAEHRRHLMTTNPIESTFAPVRARADLTKGPGSKEAGLPMIYKLMKAAKGRWRKLTGSHLVALERAGARFVKGELVEGSYRGGGSSLASPTSPSTPLSSGELPRTPISRASRTWARRRAEAAKDPGPPRLGGALYPLDGPAKIERAPSPQAGPAPLPVRYGPTAPGFLAQRRGDTSTRITL